MNKKEITEIIIKYIEWADDLRDKNLERGNTMIAYDMDSRIVAAKQILERLT